MVRGGAKEPKEIVEGVFPPILPKKEVEEVVSIIAARNRTKNRPGPNTKMHWIGRGLTRCACGGSMSTCIGGHPPNALIRYIACRARDSSAKPCRRPYLPMDHVLAVVLSRLSLDSLLQLSGKGDAEGEAVRLRSQIDRLLLKKEQINTERLNILGRALAALLKLAAQLSTASSAHCSIGSLIKTRRSEALMMTLPSCGQSYLGMKIL